MNEAHKQALAAGRESARRRARQIACRTVAEYRKHLREDAQHHADHGVGLSWAHVTIPTDAQYAIWREAHERWIA